MRHIFIFILLIFMAVLLPGVEKDKKVIDKSTFPTLKWIGKNPPGTYADYLKSFPQSKRNIILILNDFTDLQRLVSSEPMTTLEPEKVILLVNSAVMDKIPEYISDYSSIVRQLGYDVKTYIYSGGNAEDIKTILISERTNLKGAVFIGQIPSAWYEIDDDYYKYGYAEFPCDLFFMDLDGDWIDQDLNGIYDEHVDGQGSTQPEIFVSRIDSTMLNETDDFFKLKNYFSKVFKYWNGEIALLRYGLTYTEDDWSSSYHFTEAFSPLYKDTYDIIKAPDTNRGDYIDKLQDNIYDFIQLSCHSSSSAHYFTRGGLARSSEILETVPQAISYNLFCCSALRYSENNYIGGVYLFNDSLRALTVIGSTKTGSMLDFSYFYTALGQNKSYGEAFLEWFKALAPYDFWEISWHYGMTVAGDPFMTLISVPKTLFSPANFSSKRVLNRSFLQTEYIVELRWKKNPENATKDIASYRLYLTEDNKRSMYKEFGNNTFRYLFRNVNKNKKYFFSLSAVDTGGKESGAVYSVSE